MIYYGNNDWRDYLAHYGVLGMKWGIRRYQPYSDGDKKGGKFVGALKKVAKAKNDFSAKRKEKRIKKYMKIGVNRKTAERLDKDPFISSRKQKMKVAKRIAKKHESYAKADKQVAKREMAKLIGTAALIVGTTAYATRYPNSVVGKGYRAAARAAFKFASMDFRSIRYSAAKAMHAGKEAYKAWKNRPFDVKWKDLGRASTELAVIKNIRR